MQQPKTKRLSTLAGLAALLVWLAVWQLVADSGTFAFLLASPKDALLRLFEELGNPKFRVAVVFTTTRITGGFLIGLSIAIVAALISGRRNADRGFWNCFLTKLIDLPILVIRAVPIAPLVVLLLFIFETQNVGIAVAVFISLQAAYPSLRDFVKKSQALLAAAQVYNVPPFKRFALFRLGRLFPLLATTGELALGMSFKAGLAAELIAFVKHSLGLYFYDAKINLDMALLFAVTVVIIALAALLTKAFRLICELGAWLCLRLPNTNASKRGILAKIVSRKGPKGLPLSFSEALTGKKCALELAAQRDNAKTEVTNKTNAGTADSAKVETPDSTKAGATGSAKAETPDSTQASDAPAPTEPLLTIEHLNFGYTPQDQLIHDLNFSLRRGEKIVLSTPSGSGKTTLAMLIAGLLQPQNGHIEHHGRLAIAFQDARLFLDMNAVDNILSFSGHPFNCRDRARAKKLLLDLNLPEDQLLAPISDYSGGMKKRAALAAALFAKADILILDEPFAGLDQANRERAMALIPWADCAVVLITHDNH